MGLRATRLTSTGTASTFGIGLPSLSSFTSSLAWPLSSPALSPSFLPQPASAVQARTTDSAPTRSQEFVTGDAERVLIAGALGGGVLVEYNSNGRPSRTAY